MSKIQLLILRNRIPKQSPFSVYCQQVIFLIKSIKILICPSRLTKSKKLKIFMKSWKNLNHVRRCLVNNNLKTTPIMIAALLASSKVVIATSQT